MNTITITGRLTDDPEMHGNRVTFTVANNEGWGDKQQTHYFRVVAFAGTADLVQKHLRKGSWVLLSGRMTQYRTEKDGQKREYWNMVALFVEFGPRAERNGNGGGGGRQRRPEPEVCDDQGNDVKDDGFGEVPF